MLLLRRRGLVCFFALRCVPVVSWLRFLSGTSRSNVNNNSSISTAPPSDAASSASQYLDFLFGPTNDAEVEEVHDDPSSYIINSFLNDDVDGDETNQKILDGFDDCEEDDFAQFHHNGKPTIPSSTTPLAKSPLQPFAQALTGYDEESFNSIPVVSLFALSSVAAESAVSNKIDITVDTFTQIFSQHFEHQLADRTLMCRTPFNTFRLIRNFTEKKMNKDNNNREYELCRDSIVIGDHYPIPRLPFPCDCMNITVADYLKLVAAADDDNCDRHRGIAVVLAPREELSFFVVRPDGSWIVEPQTFVALPDPTTYAMRPPSEFFRSFWRRLDGCESVNCAHTIWFRADATMWDELLVHHASSGCSKLTLADTRWRRLPRTRLGNATLVQKPEYMAREMQYGVLSLLHVPYHIPFIGPLSSSLSAAPAAAHAQS